MRSAVVGLALRVGDQGLTSLASLIIVAGAARLGSDEAVGQVAVVGTVAVIASGLSRLGIYEPAVYRASTDRNAVPTARAMTLGVVIACLLIAALLAAVGQWLAAIAAANAGLLVWQEETRYIAVALDRSRQSVGISVCYVLLVGCVFLTTTSLPMLLLGWCAALGVAAAAGELLLARAAGPVVPRWVHVKQWRETAFTFSAPGLTDAVIASVTFQVLPLVLAARGSIAEVGVYRGAQALVGPLVVVLAGVGVWCLQWIQRPNRPAGLPRYVLVGLLGISAVVAYGLFLAVFGEQLQRLLLGPTMAVPAQVVWWLMVGQVALAWYLGPITQLKVMGRYWGAVPLRIVFGVGGLVLCVWTVIGTTAVGLSALGALQAILISTGVTVMVIWLRRAPQR